jgi:hypothetical protein
MEKVTMEELAEWATEGAWYDNVYADFSEHKLKLVGIEHATYAFSGFWSQGDGACFYDLTVNSRTLLEAALPEKDFLLMAAEFSLLCPNDDLFQYIEVLATKNSHQYSHEYTVTVEVDYDNFVLGDEENNVFERHITADVQTAVGEFLRKLMRALYDQLRDEYESLTSEEYLREWAAANDWEICDDAE